MKKLTLLVAVIATSFTTFAQVGIGTTTPNASAALDVSSTTKGFLPPRMTKVQLEAIASPVEGLMVYCTDCVPKTLYVFDAFNFVSTSNNTPSGLSSTDVYSTTGKTWMDRNLGATQVATSSTDAASYGDLYQWGRNTDGHQIRTSATVAGPVASGAEGTSFITSTSDWLTVPADTRWNGSAKGAHDPCPTGFKVPTDTELEAERNNGGTGFWGTGSLQNNALGAFNSALKLPLAGYRSLSAGALTSVGSFGAYWSSSTLSGTNARSLNFNSSNAGMYSDTRAYGFSVRCIKE
jgi:uncharacterized protein (TIGR02145 family)